MHPQPPPPDSDAALAPRAPRWAWWLATGFGSGWVRPAPGTWGSLAALLVWLLLSACTLTPFTTWAGSHPQAPHMALRALGVEAGILFTLLLLTWLSVRASTHVARETGLKDPGFVVADEWAGMWIALWPLRWYLAQNLFRLAGPGRTTLLLSLALPFALFRLFDIWKPWPCHELQALPEGEGIVADDVVAGLYALPLVVLIHPYILQYVR